MEFWGVEVKSGEPVEVVSGDNFILHLSQACLGEVKKDKGNESVCLYVKFADDKKFVLGTLSPDKFPQLSFDLVFEKDFELSHNWKNGSVYFSGYKITQPSSDDDSEPEVEMEEDLPVASNNGKPGSETNTTKPLSQKPKLNSTEPKQKIKFVEPNKDDKPNEGTDDSSNDESDSSDDDESSDDQDMTANGEDGESSDSDDEDDESDDEDDESDEEEETPKAAEKGKKRSGEPAKKTPLPDKKHKLVTPQKTDGKKVSGHVATPHPSKKIIKSAANSDQKKDQPQKSFSCAACNRSFGSDNALQSHNKAKHSTGK